MKKVFIFLGPPGSGKGTQTTRLAEKLSIPHIDTGSLIRKNIENETELGKVAKGFIDKGNLVPLYIAAGIIKERVLRPDCQTGFILDGYPRSIEQAEELKNILACTKFDLKQDCIAIYFKIDNEILIQRLINRRSCPKCGTIYNLISNPPKIMDYCDICDTKLTRRKDDNEQVARARFETYEKETAPLYEYYKQTGILKELNADKPISDIWEDLKEIVFKD